MSTKQMEHLFVYGTLAPNQSNAHILAPINGTWQSASVRGKLYPNGIGKSLGYPALEPSFSQTEGDVIQGLVFSSDALSEHWQRIDDFEGDGYQRILVDVTLATGEILTTFVYAFLND
ncbi:MULTISPECIES: gamma-glutamylcyclotransferase family protein [unclassified Moraxella]|uniref:gamma-glutamylcyclotransferase family protein n=1 Tax=unclassified Moraxella TaxID=2685852 RepID=UPI003AF9C289